MKIITRAEWGAAPPEGRTSHVTWTEGVDLWVHHTAGPTDQSVKSIQAFHQGPSRGWNDIGYGYLADEGGEVYEGRGFEIHAAHSPGVNHQPSVAMIGTYTSLEPTDEQHRAVYDLRAFLDAGELRGHRENTGGTTCPGDRGMSKVVDGPPPDVVFKPALYYFEELPFSEGGHGPVIVGQAKGYASKAVMTGKLAAFKAAHPKTPTSTMREGDDGSGEDDSSRYYILAWAPGTHGTRYRFGPWRDVDAREANRRQRETNTGRTMRPFSGRQRSLYPWPN